MSHSDFTAIVTGAASTRGIGRATAHTLAADGWNVAILDLDEAAAKEAADEIAGRSGVQAFGLACDVTDETSVESALSSLDASAPPVGALVNNAGITSPHALPRRDRVRVGPHLRRQRVGPSTSPAA